MQAVNTQTLIHVGVELVVVGGLTFWFQRKTSLLRGEINALREKVARHEEIISNQGQLLARHDQILRQIFGGAPPPPGITQELKPAPNVPPGHPRQPPQGQSPVKNLPKEEEPDIPPEELDKILRKELGSLKKSRASKRSKGKPKRGEKLKFIELDCAEGLCELETTPGRSKRRRLKKSRGEPRQKKKL